MSDAHGETGATATAGTAGTAPPLEHTPLDALHRELGARMGPFAGYDMPIQYPAGLKAEHAQVRNQAGLFDVSHMGQVLVHPPAGPAGSGDAADRSAAVRTALAAALPLDFDDFAPGRQKYTFLLNDAGGIDDDLMVALEPAGGVDAAAAGAGNADAAAAPRFRMVLNASNKHADLMRLRALCPALRFELLPDALLALQGPGAEAALASLDARAAGMAFMDAGWLTIDGVRCFATRSGYTGEDGWEIAVPQADAMRVARRLLAIDGVAPAGLGARDTLRLEAGLPLHGNDIGPDTTPAEAAMAWAIPKARRRGGRAAGGFPGADTVLAALQSSDGAPPERPPTRRLVGLVSSAPVPIRAGAEVLAADDGRVVGRVTSGTVSPTLGRPIMLAHVDRAALEAKAPLVAAVRQQRPPVEVTPLPFVPKRYKR